MKKAIVFFILLLLFFGSCSSKKEPLFEKAKPTTDHDTSCFIADDCEGRGFLHKDCRGGKWYCINGECVWGCKE